MSLKKKIILSFLISSMIIAVLAISAYINFLGIRKEIRYLELSDTVRSKSLLLRRHEKNFLLYGDSKESNNVHLYLLDLKTTLAHTSPAYKTDSVIKLQTKVEEYNQRFNSIEKLKWDFEAEFNGLKQRYSQYASFFRLIESTFLERPLVNADLIEKLFSKGGVERLIGVLKQLDAELSALRKNGEEILIISTDLDKSARDKVDSTIRLSQTAVLVLFPMFLAVGLAALFMISQSAVKRLKILTGAIEKAGKGDFSSLSVPTEQDEVGILIKSFNKMERDLIARDQEIDKKNEELLHSRKLASIGTLASGVAHELNNPLNNIYLAAQILSKEIGHEICPPKIKETVGDIFSQTLRVKRIVNDLLEFSREKPPELRATNIAAIIENVISQMKSSGEMAEIDYTLDAPGVVEIDADRHLLEQVFINLLGNASDAMDGKGLLTISLSEAGPTAVIKISDTGKGILPKDVSRIFDPFFTTKEKGTGLGLAIVYNIIEKHKGKIEVTSEPYKGTTFMITLPKRHET
jgi:two-component system NtrC family sensor kinase